jgi:hypothetical protein
MIKPRGRIAGFEQFLPLADFDRHQRRDRVGEFTLLVAEDPELLDDAEPRLPTISGVFGI